jgi:hypothetical protein
MRTKCEQTGVKGGDGDEEVEGRNLSGSGGGHRDARGDGRLAVGSR